MRNIVKKQNYVPYPPKIIALMVTTNCTMRNKQKFVFKLIGLIMLLGSGCARQNLIVGNLGGDQNITQVRRLVIFPFPNSEKCADRFKYFAEKELWPKRVVSERDVLCEMKKIGLAPKSDYLSREQATSIARALRADAFIIGYIDKVSVLHIKGVNLTTQKVWTRERQLNATNSVRIFVEEIKQDFLNRANINFEKIAPKSIVTWPNTLAILPIDNESVNLNADEVFRGVLEVRFKEAKYKVVPNSRVDEVLKSTFAISDGGQLKTVSPENLADSLGVDGLVYVTVHDFTYQNAGFYQGRKVAATVTMKDKFGEVLFSREVASRTDTIAIKKIVLNSVIALAKQLFETALNQQLLREVYDATDELVISMWWSEFGEVVK